MDKPDPNELTIYSDCILIMEKETKQVLYEKNCMKKMYPASTTKILTAILILEKCNLSDIVTVNQSAISAVPATYTTAKLQAGEQFTVEQLLYTMIIPSANDAANVLAEHISGSISNFAVLMNEKAKEIGCYHSNFTNPSGVHDENLYTTAYDLALIARYAMDIELFRQIVTTTKYSLPNTDLYTKDVRSFTISNAMVNSDYKDYYYEYATGIKTGFTNPAKDCLVASAKKDDVEFIAVVLGSDQLENGLRKKYLDCKTLFDFAFDNYISHYKELQEKNSKKFNFKFFNMIDVDSSDYHMDSFTFKALSLGIAFAFIFFAFVLIFTRRKDD